MRRMYLTSNLHTLPDNPEIVAYTVAGYDGQLSDFPDAMMVPVDVNGNYVSQAVVLDCVGDRFTVNRILQWVTMWEDIHTDGFSSGSKTFFKPVILIEEGLVKVMRKVLGDDACDWWTFPESERGVVYPLPLANLIVPASDNGLRYSISAVWDDTWGEVPEPIKRKPEKVPAPMSGLDGIVVYFRNGGAAATHVTSYDLGKTWRMQ